MVVHISTVCRDGKVTVEVADNGSGISEEAVERVQKQLEEIQKEEIDKYVWLPLEETFQLLKCGRTKFPKNFDYSDIFEKVRNIYYSQSKGNTQREE